MKSRQALVFNSTQVRVTPRSAAPHTHPEAPRWLSRPRKTGTITVYACSSGSASGSGSAIGDEATTGDEDTSSTFPWLAEQEGELYETFVNIRNGVQYASLLESLPNADFVAATLARGIEAIKADQAAAQKPLAIASAN